MGFSALPHHLGGYPYIFYLLGVVIIAQQVESNLISPQVLGKKLSIHPVVIIFLVMAAGRFAGFLGIILAIPTFAVASVVAVHLYRLAGLHMKGGK